MMKLCECPDHVRDCAMSLTGFIRKELEPMSYDELLSTFTYGKGITDDGNTYQVITDGGNEGYFDFDYGCLGGTFSNDMGTAHLDCLEWYEWNDEEDEMETYDIEPINI